MKASKEIIEFIKQCEGLRLTAYKCPSGVWTIGYGHTQGVTPGTTITASHAAELLEADLSVFEQNLNAALSASGIWLTQNRYDALLSFVYNIGMDKFLHSTLWRKIKSDPNDPGIANEFRRWTRSSGKIIPGLVSRREKEARLYDGLAI